MWLVCFATCPTLEPHEPYREFTLSLYLIRITFLTNFEMLYFTLEVYVVRVCDHVATVESIRVGVGAMV